METILAFVWGMITVVYTLMAVVVVQMRKSVKQLESQIRDTNETLQDVYKQLEEKESSLIRYTDELNHNNENTMIELYRYIDSRFDKFENKVINKKEILKG
jgi:predicted Holliday junction resolvase-like endonuclease